MQHLDEGTIHAWIDGALPSDDANRVELHVASCAECAAKVADARGLVAASSRIVSALDATPGGVLPAFGGRRARRRWTLGMSVGAAIAATLVVAIGFEATRNQISPTASASKPVDAIATKPAELPPAADSPSPSMSPVPNRVAADRRADAAARTLGAIVEAAPKATADSSPPMLAAVARDTVVRSEARRRTAIATNTAAVGGTGGVGSIARSQPAVAAQNAFARTVDLSERAAFVGCYEVDESTDVLPKRFALRVDSVGGNEVRYVDSTSAIGGRIADLSWMDLTGQAVIRSMSRGTILTIMRTPASLTAQSVLGPRTIRVVNCH